MYEKLGSFLNAHVVSSIAQFKLAAECTFEMCLSLLKLKQDSLIKYCCIIDVILELFCPPGCLS